MEDVEWTLAKDAHAAISKEATERKVGARHLRSIMESVLLDRMFDLPSLEEIGRVAIAQRVVGG
jgi:ATP-dependent Clp protease ATP-binding subunit ClpX